jgi:hypothetical protein
MSATAGANGVKQKFLTFRCKRGRKKRKRAKRDLILWGCPALKPIWPSTASRTSSNVCVLKVYPDRKKVPRDIKGGNKYQHERIERKCEKRKQRNNKKEAENETKTTAKQKR